MSTPNPGRCRYNGPSPYLRRAAAATATRTVWSSLLGTHVSKRRRRQQFIRASKWATVHSVEPGVSVPLVHGTAYVGRRMPFEAEVVANVLRVDVHQSVGRKLTLTIITPGGVTSDASAGGTYPIPGSSGGWLLAKCSRRRTCATLLRTSSPQLNINAVGQTAKPGLPVAAALVAPGWVALVHVAGSNALVCPACAYAAPPHDMARHFGVNRFMGLLRSLTASGLGPRLVPKNAAPSRPAAVASRGNWRKRFLRDTADGAAVAWHHMPVVSAAEVSKRLRRASSKARC